MPFVVPNFNLLCNIGSGTGAGVFPRPPFVSVRLANQECALVYGRRVNAAFSGDADSGGPSVFQMNLLLPMGTDIRGVQDSSGSVDLVECPAGSGRWYSVSSVDDVGKGYANEHRTAGLAAVPGSWSAPYA